MENMEYLNELEKILKTPEFIESTESVESIVETLSKIIDLLSEFQIEEIDIKKVSKETKTLINRNWSSVGKNLREALTLYGTPQR